MEYPEKFTLVITEEHLDRGIREVWDMKQDVCENCAIAMAAKDKFGDMFQGMGFSRLHLFGTSSRMGDRIAYTCADADDITDHTICSENREMLATMLPKTLVFVRKNNVRKSIWEN